MRKTFKYRIFPTHKQTTALEQTLDGCRWLYNHLLEQRINSWESEKKSLSRYDQSNTLKHLKEENPFLSNVYSQVQQNVCTRIDLAFRSFYRRVKSDAKPGYPRFRGAERYDSFTYPQAGFKLYENVIHLSKIGDIKIKLHRPIEGIVKTCTIKRMPTGKWFVNLSCNVEHTPIPRPIEPAIGIDMGLKQFAVLSNGEQYPNPRFFKQEERVLAKAQNRLSKQTKNTPKRHKAKKVVTRIHERIKNIYNQKDERQNINQLLL